MKKIPLWCALLSASFMIHDAQAVVVGTVIPSVVANTPASPAAVPGYSSSVDVPEGTWTYSEYNWRITAANGGAVPITRITSLDLIIISNVGPGPVNYSGDTWTFNADNRAYDALGNDITVSAGLIGTLIEDTNLTPANMYELRITKVNLPGLSGSNVHSINTDGQFLSGELVVGVRSGGAAASQNDMASAAAVTNIVPVPELGIGVMTLAASGICLLARRRGSLTT